jgi:hypothetical protein
MNDNNQPLILDADEKPVVSEKPVKSTRPQWRSFYGWTATPAQRDTGLKDIHDKPLMETLPFPANYLKTFSHKPGEYILGAPIRGGLFATMEPPLAVDPSDKVAYRHYRRIAKRINQTKSRKYMIMPDRSIRRVDKMIKKQLAGMTPQQQAEFVAKAMGTHNAQTNGEDKA